MKIHCRVLRDNGTYATVHVNAGKDTFELNKKIYFVTGYNYGKAFGVIPYLTATYIENMPQPINVSVILSKNKIKLDSKGVRNATNKQILSVFTDSPFTKLEMLMILLNIATMGISAFCLFLLLNLSGMFGVI